MPFLKYKILDPKDNIDLTTGIVNVLNNQYKQNYLRTNISQIRQWQFPNGSLYISVIPQANMSEVYSAILDTSGNYLKYLSQTFAPHIIGNIPINYVTMYQLITSILLQNGYLFNASMVHITAFYEIALFEYYLDPICRDSYTFMINFQQSNR